MNRNKFSGVLDDTFTEMKNILVKKGNDYATTDVLSNFKRLSGAAKALNIDVQTPVGYALFMCLMKLDRINNLITNDKNPSNESIQDSFMDELGYTLLGLALYVESMNVEEER